MCGVCGSYGKGSLGLMNESNFSRDPTVVLPKIYFHCNECGNGHMLESWEIALLCDYTDFYHKMTLAASKGKEA